jgi:hypothetical protein
MVAGDCAGVEVISVRFRAFLAGSNLNELKQDA